MSKLLAFLVAILLSGVAVLADYFIKKASLLSNIWNRSLLIGAIIYGLSAIGWVIVMKSLKLSTLGVIFGLSCIILVTTISVVFFHEKLSTMEIIGIVLAILSMIFLYRFS
jgi:multidrug transporter EmrE-like cation transporter